jgi:hypothetical protein
VKLHWRVVHTQLILGLTGDAWSEGDE